MAYKRDYYLAEMERLYTQHAYSDQEMASHLETTRTNVWKMRQRMEQEWGLYEESRGRYRSDPNRRINRLRLNASETVALYLAGRRLQQQTRTQQKSVASALEKLALALRNPLEQSLVEAAQQILAQKADPQRTHILHELVQAWLQRYYVEITHRVLHGKARVYRVAPYHFEPSVWGDAIYLIGHSEYHQGLATFKVARIEAVGRTAEFFEIPEAFDVQALLRHAWGIWHTDEEPTTVRLHFTKYVAPRVTETIWHPSEALIPQDDGTVIWAANVAEWREMVPWVRGWGSDVEVLEPGPLREAIIDHAARLSALYDLRNEEAGMGDELLHLWGKTDKRRDDIYHPALYHIFDVAHVAQQLLSRRASPRWRRVLADALNAEAESLHEWVPWVVALHDIGKLSASFQAQNAAQKQRLQDASFDFGNVQRGNHLHHTVVGSHVLADALPEQLPDRLERVLTAMIGGHHGVYNFVERGTKRRWRNQREPEAWARLRRQAVEVLTAYLLLDSSTLPEPVNLSAAIGTLNGFTILCDWLGSDERYFKPAPLTSLTEYVTLSRQLAESAVLAAGFFVPVASNTPPTFEALFAGWEMRPLQEVAGKIPERLLMEKSLTIAEAPTGEGKTEFALTLARRIAALRDSDEMYVALPTMATSNAMFQRIQEHLRERLGLDPETVKLIHGQDFLLEDDLRLDPLESGEQTTPPSLEWFSPKKRALLAPFGVGTIDQAMFIALNTRHNALRLVGLAGKVVILDEVHAYDTYMTTIIERLLAWLSACGASVVLLSATLPTARRQSLLEAYAGEAQQAEGEQSMVYPSVITVGSGEQVQHVPPSYLKEKKTELHILAWDDEQTAEKAAWLRQQVQDGGCACWIANTVQRAQDIFEALQAYKDDEIDLTLLHARFPLEERQEREQKILARYGKGGERPEKGIVVGTQVLEQSLDVDFDVMASDHAPIDLVLQREGRLHRHDRTRPEAHDVPRLYVNAIRDVEGRLVLGNDRFYEEYIMRRSWHTLRDKAALRLPADYRPLIEMVYHEEKPEEPELLEAWQRLEILRDNQAGEAKLRIIQPPHPDDPFCYSLGKTFEEDEEGTAWINAQTRLGPESVTVIPLERQNDRAQLVPLDESVATDHAANRAEQLRLLQRSLRVSNRVMVQAMKQQTDAERTPLFTESPLLRHVYPLWLTGEQALLEVDGRATVVELDAELGLRIEKREDSRGEGMGQ